MIMASEYEIRRLLKEATEKLLRRQLTSQEIDKLYQYYQQEYGTVYNKSIKALSKFSALSESQIHEKRSSSDDLDRVMQDLANKDK